MPAYVIDGVPSVSMDPDPGSVATAYVMPRMVDSGDEGDVPDVRDVPGDKGVESTDYVFRPTKLEVIFLVVAVVFLVIDVVQMFVLTSYSGGSNIMMGIGYVMIFLVACGVGLVCLWSWVMVQMPKSILSRRIAAILFGVLFVARLIVQSLVSTVMVYRQATETYWDLFVALPVPVQVMLITTVITMVITCLLYTSDAADE